MQDEPLLSLPIGLVIAALLGLILLIVALIAVINRLREGRRPSSLRDWMPGILGALPWGALIVAPSGQVMASNEAAERCLGVSRGDRAPGPLAEAARRMADSAVPETVHLAIPGDQTRLSVEASPLNPEGEMRGVLLLLREPENEGRREAGYRRLVGALSHELRTPLTAIKGHIEFLESLDPEDEELRRRSSDFISSSIDRLSRLVEDLLSVSRIESTPVNRLTVNPRSVAEEAISALYNRAEEKEVTILLQAAPHLPRVLADSDRLQQVLINLLDNAIKYSLPGSSVLVELSPNADRVRFSVSDRGPGIPAEEQPHLFEPFFRGDREKAGSISGTGLGLTIVKSILDKHGAEISVESRPGEGTRFSFELKSVEPPGR